MKYLYICEKCGKTFTDSDKAWACEYSHTEPEFIHGWTLEQGSTLTPFVYTNGETVASVAYLKVHTRDENGSYIYDDDGYPVYEVYPFKRMKRDGICVDIEKSLRKRWVADHKEEEVAE